MRWSASPGSPSEDAKAELLASIEAETRREAAKLARRIEEEAREGAERVARRLVVDATQRVSLKEPVESTISFVALPSDEMKGRIIGREGRNIRALEMATGIDVIIDDTPGAILLSSFDPVRREIARVAIQRLLEDGRIHPARIEEVVAKVREEFETLTEETGASGRVRARRVRSAPAARAPRGAPEVPPLPRPQPAAARGRGRPPRGPHRGRDRREGRRRAPGGAPPRDRPGRRRRGRPSRCASRRSWPPSSASATRSSRRSKPSIPTSSRTPSRRSSSAIANRISENRPGARKDNLDVFIERLRRIEALACAFPGVTQAFALKAGKELRVLVDTKAVRTSRPTCSSKQIARAIERELDYPGTIRVSVVRETRAVQYAV